MALVMAFFVTPLSGPSWATSDLSGIVGVSAGVVVEDPCYQDRLCVFKK